MLTPADYYLLGLLLIAILGILYSRGRAIGRLEGRFDGLNECMDLFTRHRHDDAGRVVITPEEVAAA